MQPAKWKENKVLKTRKWKNEQLRVVMVAMERGCLMQMIALDYNVPWSTSRGCIVGSSFSQKGNEIYVSTTQKKKDGQVIFEKEPKDSAPIILPCSMQI